MTVRNEGLTKAFNAGGAIPARRFLKFGSDDDTLILAAAAGDSIIGVSDRAAASGERVDAILTDIPMVEYGGNITRGNLITSDSVGRAVAVTGISLATGVNARIAGIAMSSGVSGDLGSVLLSPGSFQG